MEIDRIAALLTTHSHQDHMGGAAAILGEYQDMIDVFGFVKDDQFLETAYWARLSELIYQGLIQRNQLVRLECNPVPQIIWQDTKLNATLRVLAPLPVQNIQAEQHRNANATSAVLILDVRSHRIVFGADSALVEWQDIHAMFGKIACDVLATPHHGGTIHTDQAALDWLYNDALGARHAVISVGTTNTYGHPRADVVRSLRASGATVLCTQMTEQCSDDLESLRTSITPKTHVGASSNVKQLNLSGRSRNVRCAGTVRVKLVAGKLNIDNLSAHQVAVKNLPQKSKCPLCQLPC